MSVGQGQVYIWESGVRTDRSLFVHDESAFTWTNTRGQRGTAQFTLMIDAGITYLPKAGWVVEIWDVDQASVALNQRVWLGLINDFAPTYIDDAGNYFVQVNCVTFEMLFDSIPTPQSDYQAMMSGDIFTGIFNGVIGLISVPVTITLGTVDSGVFISDRQYTGNTNSAADFAQLSTDAAYVWYVDPRDAKVYYHAYSSRPAADPITDGLYGTISWAQNQSDFRDRQLIQSVAPVNPLPGLTATFLGDGTTTAWTLPSIASQVTSAAITTMSFGTSDAVFTGQPNPGDTIVTSCPGMAVFTYTFVATLDNTVPFQVLIGATAADTAQNLADCFNGVPSRAGIGYSSPSFVSTEIQAGALTGSTFTVTARIGGVAVIALTESATNFSWSANPISQGSLSGILQLSVGPTGGGLFEVQYDPGTPNITTVDPVKDGVTLTITYQPAVAGQLGLQSGVAASLGLPSQFRIQAARGATSAEALTQQAAAELAIFAALPKTVTITNYIRHLFCGELATLALTDPAVAAAVLNGQWLIQEIQAKWIAGSEFQLPPYDYFQVTYTLINTTEISTYQDTLAKMVDTGPFQQPTPLTPSAIAQPPTGTPIESGTSAASMTAGQQWVQESLALAITDSGDDLVMGSGTSVSSASHSFSSGDVGLILVIAPGTIGWTAGQYTIVSVSAGAATLSGAPATAGATAGPWGLASSKGFQFTWAPAVSYWTGNQIAIVEILTPNNDSPLTFKARQLTPFRYAEQSFTIQPISGNLGGDYVINGDILTLRDAPASDDIVLVEYFPDQPEKLPHRKAGDPPAHTPLFLIAMDDGTSAGLIAMTSPDGITWTVRTVPLADTGWTCAVNDSGSTYVLGTEQNTSVPDEVASSSDAITWTAHSTPADNMEVFKIIWGGGQFVALTNASGATVMTSPDGVTWTGHSVPTPGAGWLDLAYSPSLGLYVAISSRSSTQPAKIMTSTDAVTWTDLTTGTDVPVSMNNSTCIAWGAGIFVVLGGLDGSGQNLVTSTDGITWTQQTDPNLFGWLGVTFGGGKFVAVGHTAFGDQTMNSADGITWTSAAAAANKTWVAVAYSSTLSLYVAVASQAAATDNVMTSPDATTWTSATTPSAAFLHGVCFG